MSEKEKQVVEKLKEVIPEMTEFDKGYILGKNREECKRKQKQRFSKKGVRNNC